jgi:hypothetical protein
MGEDRVEGEGEQDSRNDRGSGDGACGEVHEREHATAEDEEGAEQA